MNVKHWVSRIWSQSSYPRAPGAENRDNFERNRDNPLRLPVTQHGIMGLSAVWRCVRLVSESIGSLPFDIFERVPGQDDRIADDLTLQGLVHDTPDGERTAFTFWQCVVAAMLLRGVAYAEIGRGTQNQIVRLDWRSPDDVTRNADKTGWLYKGRTIPNEDMFRVLAFSFNGEDPVSAIEYGCMLWNSALSAETAAANHFRNGLMSTIYFKMKEVLKEHQRTEFRDNYKKEIGGALNAGNPPLLEGGMEAAPLGVNPKDAQLLDSRKWSIEEICRWFGVLPFMIGHASQGQTNWGSGIEQQMIGFLTFSLRPLVVAIEQSAKLKFFDAVQRKRFYMRCALEGLLRADSASRAAFYASALQNGWMNRDTVCKLEKLPMPLTGGEIYTVQSNLLPLDKLGLQDAAQSQLSETLKRLLGIETKQGA